MMNNKNWPKICFGELADFKNGINFSSNEKGYSLKVLGVGDFKQRTTLEQVGKISSIQTKKEVNTSYYLKDGDLVFVRSNGNKSLVGRCMLIHTKGEKISYSGFTIRARLISDKIKPEFVSLLMQGGLLKNILKRDSRGTNISNLNQEILSKLLVPLPDIHSQNEILVIFSSWDEVIEKIEDIIISKQKQLEWLKTTLINKCEYSKVQLSNCTYEVSIRNSDNHIARVLSVTNRNGFVLPEDRFKRRIASTNISNYKIVKSGQYAYNPSRINVGSIARLDDWDEGALSPMYIVFELDNTKINSDFFLHWLFSSEAKQRIRNSAQGSVRETVSFTDLGAISIALPPLEEQESISNLLNIAQQEINLLKQLVEKYRIQKRGLMQKLLTGKWKA